MDERGSILIVDSDVGFAAMLQESLEEEGEYRAVVAHSGVEAVEIASSQTFDLAIVDLGIEAEDDLDGAAVARGLRAEQSDLRLVLTPVEGDALPEELADLDVESVLPKPFFLPDLYDLIGVALPEPPGGPEPPEAPEEAIEADEGPPPEAPEEPAPPEEGTPAEVPGEPAEREEGGPSDVERAEMSYEGSPEVVQELEDLAWEMNAEAVVVTDGGEIVASAGWLSPEVVDQLAQIITESYRSSEGVAEVLGRERQRFEQTLEGGEYVLYSLTVTGDVILSAAVPTHVALGIVRYRVKKAAERLRHLVSVEQ